MQLTAAFHTHPGSRRQRTYEVLQRRPGVLKSISRNARQGWGRRSKRIDAVDDLLALFRMRQSHRLTIDVLHLRGAQRLRMLPRAMKLVERTRESVP